MEKGVLELLRAATIKPRKIERSGFFSTGPQWTNMNLQTGLRYNKGLVPEKSRFSDRGGLKGPPPVPERVKVEKRYSFHCSLIFQMFLELNKKINVRNKVWDSLRSVRN